MEQVRATKKKNKKNDRTFYVFCKFAFKLGVTPAVTQIVERLCRRLEGKCLR